MSKLIRNKYTILVIFLFCVLSGCSSEKKTIVKQESSSSSVHAKKEQPTLPLGTIHDWNLILVNQNNMLKSEPDILLSNFDNNMSMDKRITSYYKKMVQAAKNDNIRLYLRSSYRSISTQQGYYDATIASYLAAGYTKKEAIKKTEEYIAIPRASEHHTGLALDIISLEWQENEYDLTAAFDETEAFNWLEANAAKYGFILRYPKDKEEITNILYEPWHYRYVGIEHAAYMQDHNLSLEEYLLLLDKK